MKKFITILTALSLILALCVTFAACGEKKITVQGKSDSEAAEEAFNTIFECEKNNDIKGAAEIYFEANFKLSETKEEFIERCENLERDQGELERNKNSTVIISSQKELKDSELNSLKNQLKETSAGNHYEVDDITKAMEYFYIVTYPSGQEVGMTCYPVKVGGKWYVACFMI